MTFRTLVRREPRAVAFGFLHTVAATVGQTFVISLFLPGMKESFALSDAHVSVVFTVTTLASAAALWKIGAWIDRTDLLRYCISCGVLLVASCALIAGAHSVAVLVFGMFCLRLAGNGLLTHVALTATARYFSSDRGQALSLVLLGSSAGEGALPAMLVAAIGAWGWRWTLLSAGCLGLMLVLLAAFGVRRLPRFRAPHGVTSTTPSAVARDTPRQPHADRTYFAWTGALFVAMPMVITAMIFHQAVIAQDKGVSLQWFAVSFTAFAVVRVPVSIFTGKLVDRIGSDRLFCLHLVPLAAGSAALIVTGSPWVVPLYWFCAGVTAGMGSVLQTTVIAERVPLDRLGSARSVLAAVTIVASAAGPSLYGLALAAGARIPSILWGSVAVLAAATLLGFLARRPDQ